VAAVAAAPGPAGASERYAEQVTAANAAERLVAGSDATGGLGDWALGNGHLCAVVSDPDHESHLSARGGVLIDLARCGVAHDEWNTVETLLNLSREQMLTPDTVRAEPDRPDGSVAIVAGARMHGLEIETAYVLSPAEPDALRIETRAARLAGDDAGEAARAFLFGDVVLHGRRQLAPFTIQLEPDARGVRAPGSVGFAHPHTDPDDLLTMVDAILPANLHVLLGGDRQQPGVAYGLRLVGAQLVAADGSSRPLPSLAINGESFSMYGVFTRPFWVGGGDVGLLELAQTLFMDIEPGETLVLTREVRVGARADVASVTDQLWPDGPALRGRVEPDARVHVSTADGTPITQARPDAGGGFALRVPASGRYRVSVQGPNRRSLERSADVGVEGLDLGPLDLPPTGTVELPAGEAMRLVFVPLDGGPAPDFGDDHLGFRIGDEAFRGSHHGRDVSLGGFAGDPREIPLPPGRYRVLATRGPEFALAEAEISVAAGARASLAIEAPGRVLEHPGWVSADMHVHSEWSDDSNLRVERQLAAFVAEGADLIVSTEHDRVADYGPLIARFGLGERLKSLVGAEVTSSAHTAEAPGTAGHSNAFPLPYRPLAFRGGAPRGEGRRLRAIIAEVHGLGGLLQLNHPRSGRQGVRDLNYFTHLAIVGEPFRPASPLEEWPNLVLLEKDPETGLRDLDFDTIELLNGASMRQYRATRSDWYSLLLQGEFRPAVANSDSHVAGELVAYPRTYVRLALGAATTPERLEPAAFVEALARGHAYGSTGPLLDLELVSPDGARTGIGGLHPGRRGTLRVSVRAAAWVPVGRLQVWQDGREIHQGAIAVDAPVELPIAFERDGFLTLEVSGEPSPDYAAVAPDFVPFAFSNPIFVDADGDGRFTAPGLPRGSLPILEPEAD